MDYYIQQIIKNKDFKYKENDYEITQNHLTALSGSIEFDKNSEERDTYGNTVWHYLARSGNYEVLKQAVKDYPEIKELKNRYGDTIWHYFEWSGNYEGLEQVRFDSKIL